MLVSKPSTYEQYSFISQDVLHEYLHSVVEDLDYNEAENDPITRISNRFYVMAFACNNGYEGCINHAVTTFNNGLRLEQYFVVPG